MTCSVCYQEIPDGAPMLFVDATLKEAMSPMN